MRLMLFFDGRNAKRAWPVVREYIRPNVKPKKSNSPSGTLQSEEERSRPRCAGDLSREGGKRAVTRALPREAVIEHQDIIGSTLPFSNQPSSRLQLGTRTYPHLLAPVELLSKLTELTLPLRAEAAESDLLHPVCDSSQQQFAAEVRRRLRFVENAPLLPKLAEAELGEAQQRLPASRCILDRAPHAGSGAAMR